MPAPPQATSHESYHEAADRERLRPLLRAGKLALRVSFPKLRALPRLPLYGENSMSHEILKALASRRWFLGVAGSGLLVACGGSSDTDAELADGALGKPDEGESKTNLLGNRNGWQLELPINEQGGLSGKTATLDFPITKGVPGWTNYFDATTKKLTFKSPVEGARTDNAGGARCEMKQAKANRWNARRDKRFLTLTQTLQTTASGSEPRVVIGQLHDGIEHQVMVKYYGPTNATGATGERGRIMAEFNTGGIGTKVVLDAAYALGTAMSVTIDCNRGKAKVLYKSAGTTKNTSSYLLNVPDEAGRCFFKFGAYPQKTGADANSVSMAQVDVTAASIGP
jgi:hypothetical protein